MELKSFVSHWPPQRWQEYEPLLNYGRDNVVQLVACGTLFKVLRTVQADGIRGISKAERKTYAHPAGSGFISGFTSISCRPSKEINFPTQSIPFGPSSYLSAQARVVSDNFTSYYKWRSYRNAGGGDWCIIARKMQKKNQTVILLDPERQSIRREGEVPVADFLWYSAARPCTINCFDRAEIDKL